MKKQYIIPQIALVQFQLEGCLANSGNSIQSEISNSETEPNLPAPGWGEGGDPSDF